MRVDCASTTENDSIYIVVAYFPCVNQISSSDTVQGDSIGHHTHLFLLIFATTSSRRDPSGALQAHSIVLVSLCSHSVQLHLILY